ncbi:zincin-like metallopeptidase domain-containing protein, partial [Desulfovibrio sp. ZJ369]|uniref:zincin-like metallopeptidase domain-containing protein n=1 Tax=Desulfovibrio sp. ZJ369 TaxID=2709793 RepID=UPI0013ED6DEE
MTRDKKERIPFHVAFAEKVIKMLEEGTAPWQKPWHPAENLAPRNPLSGTVYRGVNRLHLAMSGAVSGYEDPRWMTLKQANEAGYRIKPGSRSTTVVYYQFVKEQDRLDENGQPVLGDDGKPLKETVALERPILRMARVFNAQQVENFPPIPAQEKAFAWNPQEKAEAVLTNSGAVIKHDQHDRAFYSLLSDSIHLPPKGSFDQADKYYATALHELGHWTGAPTRMNREFGPRGSKAYAKEELRAEISSWMVGQDIGVGHEPGQHAAYVKSWVQALREDPLEIMRACRDAEQIRDYVLGLEMQKEKTREQSVERGQEAASMAAPAGAPVLDPAPAKTYLHVAYKDKEAAKSLGARWDGRQKRWYAPQGTNLEPLRRFLTPLEHAFASASAAAPAENLSPQEEFARKLTDLGLDLKGRLPELDGKLHRVPLLAKSGRGVDGAYCLHGDGIPAGWAQNHVTGEKVTLVATGVVLSPAERERQQQERAARLQTAEAERIREQDAAAQRCQSMWESFSPAVSSPYLEKKGVEAFGLKEDQGNLIVPLRNIHGELRGFQAIAPDGRKGLATGIGKKGNFHLIGA